MPVPRPHVVSDRSVQSRDRPFLSISLFDHLQIFCCWLSLHHCQDQPLSSNTVSLLFQMFYSRYWLVPLNTPQQLSSSNEQRERLSRSQESITPESVDKRRSQYTDSAHSKVKVARFTFAIRLQLDCYGLGEGKSRYQTLKEWNKKLHKYTIQELYFRHQTSSVLITEQAPDHIMPPA